MLLLHGTNQVNYALKQGVNCQRIKILPFLSDDLRKIPVTNSGLRSTLGITGKKVVLYFGRITPQKGLTDLLTACSQIGQSMKNVVLLICGGADNYFLDFFQANSYEKECHAMAEKLLLGKVIFTGPVNPSKKQDCFALADLFVHSNTDMGELTEGWGLVLNESASMGISIITTDRVGSVPDLLDDGYSGYILRAGDVGELSSTIKELLEQDERRQQFGMVSHQLLERYHQLLNIHANCLGGIS